jgi:RNA polymerase sigma-70 factor (ECF subfamily)
MMSSTEKFRSVIVEACGRILSRASNARGLAVADAVPRVSAAVEKYLFRSDQAPEPHEIKSFIDDIRADDLCLIIACERGDEGAWEDLVAGFDSTVRSAARKICSNNEDAEDLASSIWAELYGLRHDAAGNKKSKLAYYSGRGSLAGWLRAVVSQLAVDQFRKESRFVQVEETREFENLAEASSNNDGNGPVVSHTKSPEEMFSDQETARDVSAALKHAIATLEPEDRLILKLYYFDDLKLKDIARTFGYHEATASRKVARLHAEIRRSVEKQLRTRHRWSDDEVKRHLAETAEKLGLSIERLVAVLMLAALLQDFYR